jgi:hypothetical protein
VAIRRFYADELSKMAADAGHFLAKEALEEAMVASGMDPEGDVNCRLDIDNNQYVFEQNVDEPDATPVPCPECGGTMRSGVILGDGLLYRTCHKPGCKGSHVSAPDIIHE